VRIAQLLDGVRGLDNLCVFTVFTLIMSKDIKKKKADWTNVKISMLIEIMFKQVRARRTVILMGYNTKWGRSS
jgi:hypothetical protein